MRDESIERRIRANLRHEADSLQLTITPAELERRLVLRSRLTTGRRTALLLAAAVGIGLLGIGGVIGGLLDDPTRSPEPTHAAPMTRAPSQSNQPAGLPSLDAILAFARGGSVVIAHAHGWMDKGGSIPAAILPDVVSVDLGVIEGSTRYQLTVVCLGDGVARLDIRLPASRGPWTGPDVECDGAFYEQPITADGTRQISLRAPRTASWRIVVRRLDGAPSDPVLEIPVLEPGDGEEALVDVQVLTMPSDGGVRPTDAAMPLIELEAVPGRLDYLVRVWCSSGPAIRYVHGDELDGRVVPGTTTQVDCDGSVHTIGLGIPEPFGSRVYVAANPGTRFSVLVSSVQPPVSLVRDEEDWRLAGGIGPDLAFDETVHAFSGVGADGGGPLQIVVDCAGTGTIEVTVDLDADPDLGLETFVAECTSEGVIHVETFDVEAYAEVHVEYATRPGLWTALTLLVPATPPPAS
jgi:hypothetical protein